MKQKPENLCFDRVRLARLAKKMKQVEVSAALETDHKVLMNRNAIGRIERNERGVYDFELVALAKVLEVDPVWLFLGEGKSELDKFLPKD